MNLGFDLTLYMVTDSSRLKGRSLSDVVKRGIDGGVTLVQLREKEMCGAEFFDLTSEILTVTRAAGVSLIVDDRVDIALAAKADGVHLGALDLPIAAAKALLSPGMILGATAKTVDSALKAQADGADYLGVGAMFETTTKVITKRTDKRTLSEICSAVDIPVVAIGGINAVNARELAGCLINGIAVVSALMDAGSTQDAARELREQCERILERK